MQDNTTAFRPKSRAEQVVENRTGEPVETLLRRLYVDEGLSQEQIAVRLGVSRGTTQKWFIQYRIPVRDRRALSDDAA